MCGGEADTSGPYEYFWCDEELRNVGDYLETDLRRPT
jgi:hypothetical protein